MRCGDKEWKHFQVEKRGCKGCYYDEIEVKEYIRIHGEIAQISKKGKIDNHYIYNAIYRNGKEYVNTPRRMITKHSKNIIDLIEVGDIVNGYKVLDIADNIYANSKRILIYKSEKEKYERWIYIQEHDGKIHTQNDIKTILTHEQYKKNCYKVEE